MFRTLVYLMTDENISFFIDDANVHDFQSANISDFLADGGDYKVSQMLNYQLNLNVKQLLRICDYYGISKRVNKCTKDCIISALVEFEENQDNNDVVSRRRLMWFYIEELKNDKLMKKFVFW